MDKNKLLLAYYRENRSFICKKEYDKISNFSVFAQTKHNIQVPSEHEIESEHFKTWYKNTTSKEDKDFLIFARSRFNVFNKIGAVISKATSKKMSPERRKEALELLDGIDPDSPKLTVDDAKLIVEYASTLCKELRIVTANIDDKDTQKLATAIIKEKSSVDWEDIHKKLKQYEGMREGNKMGKLTVEDTKELRKIMRVMCEIKKAIPETKLAETSTNSSAKKEKEVETSFSECKSGYRIDPPMPKGIPSIKMDVITTNGIMDTIYPFISALMVKKLQNILVKSPKEIEELKYVYNDLIENHTKDYNDRTRSFLQQEFKSTLHILNIVKPTNGE
jgi:hypothetical protein